MPFPDDIGAACAVGSKLQNHLRPQASFRNDGGVAARLQGFFCREMLPCNGEDIAVGLHFDVVVQACCAVVQRERPKHVVVPCSALDGGAASACPNGVVGEHAVPVGHDNVPVFLEIGHVARTQGVCIGPTVHHLTTHVEQIDIGLVVRINQVVAFFDQVGLKVRHTHGVLGKRSRGHGEHQSGKSQSCRHHKWFGWGS